MVPAAPLPSLRLTQTARFAVVQTGGMADGADGAADADEVADPMPSASAAATAAAARRAPLIIPAPRYDVDSPRGDGPRRGEPHAWRRRCGPCGCDQASLRDGNPGRGPDGGSDRWRGDRRGRSRCQRE